MTIDKTAKWTIGLTIPMTLLVLIQLALAADGRYAKQMDVESLTAYVHVEFTEIHLEITQERINKIEAVPDSQREQWQVSELLRLIAVKDQYLRRLEKRNE